MKLVVGQIVFVFFKKGGKLLPARVIEEHRVKSINADMAYKYMLEFDPMKEPVDACKLEAELFATAEDATNTLFERQMTTIEKLVAHAQAMATNLFPHEHGATEVKPQGPEQDSIGDGTTEQDGGTVVELSDGRVAKLVQRQRD